MKRNFAGAFGLLLAASILFGCASQPSGSGWITLIDGTSGMENWNATGSNANWRAEDGAILADKSTGKESSVLVSKRSFRDFHLYVEFWASEDTNSGIYIRIMNPNQVSTATGAYRSADLGQEPESGLCDRQPRERRVRESDPQGRRPLEYVRIYAKGPEITVRLNGNVTVSVYDKKFPEGRIGIQFNGGPIKVRKLMVKEL